MSANRSRKGRKSSGASGWVFAIILLSGIVSFFQIPHNPTVSGIWDILVSKSATVESWARGTADRVIAGDWDSFPDLGDYATGTPGKPSEPGKPATGTVSTQKDILASLAKVTVKEPTKVDYNRDDWKHWTSISGGCWDTREQVLYEEAVKGTIVLLDSNKTQTSDVSKACSVKTGTWIDPYTGVEMKDPSKIDIDHVIPLGWAAKNGGNSWDKTKKSAYANDLEYTDHLIASAPGANRAKGDKGPGEWKPENKSYWCTYATTWTFTIVKWKLTVGSADLAAIKEMASTCK